MPDTKRFITFKTAGGARFIKDCKDNSKVCIVLNSGRDTAHTDAMVKVMLDALNGAVEKKNGNKCEESEAC